MLYSRDGIQGILCLRGRDGCRIGGGVGIELDGDVFRIRLRGMGCRACGRESLGEVLAEREVGSGV